MRVRSTKQSVYHFLTPTSYDMSMADLIRKPKKADREDLDAEEEWFMYDERKSEESLNRYEGAFTEKAKKGINTAPSVFDRTAVFQTK